MAESEYPQHIQKEYSPESSLNTLDICLPRSPSENPKTGLWVIYIHGGAWRDPLVDATSFKKTQFLLLASPIGRQISGCASINYRLSPYPSHSSHPSDPSDPSRNAKHPDHINDVLTALLYLQDTYKFEDRYILVGHSCGATLAMQVVMKRYWGQQYESTTALELNVVPPVGIVGACGIYDLPALVKYHEAQEMYRAFVVNAFGQESGWAGVSPARWAEYEGSWEEGKLVVVAESKGDSLVEGEQGELMRKSLVGQGWQEDEGVERRLKMFEVEGDHNEVWGTGDLASPIEWAVKYLVDKDVS